MKSTTRFFPRIIASEKSQLKAIKGKLFSVLQMQIMFSSASVWPDDLICSPVTVNTPPQPPANMLAKFICEYNSICSIAITAIVKAKF